MKKTKVIYKIIILTIIIIAYSFFKCNIVKASDEIVEDQGGAIGSEEGDSGGGGGSVGLPSLEGYGPNISSGRATQIISSILGVFTVLGTVMVVVAIAIIGFNTILGSASEKAEYNQKLVGVIIATIILTCGSIIARVLIGVAEKF